MLAVLIRTEGGEGVTAEARDNGPDEDYREHLWGEGTATAPNLQTSPARLEDPPVSRQTIRRASAAGHMASE